MNDLAPLVDQFAKLEPWRGNCAEGQFANFLGVVTDLEFVARHHPSNVTQTDDEGKTVIQPPRISDGEPFFEYAAIHKAIQNANQNDQDKFVMVELGGGYAARCVDAYQALQSQKPMPAQLVIVEAEPTHFQWAKRHLRNNGIDPDDHWLINAAVCPDYDPVMFMQGAGTYYNSIVEPGALDRLVEQVVALDNTRQLLLNLLATGETGVQVPYNSSIGSDLFRYKFVSALPLADILAPLAIVDLIDIDIQGAEKIVLPPAMEALNRRVKRIHIGTHGAGIHSEIWDLFFDNEWNCEIDFPPDTHNTTPWGDFETSDGILHLSNPRL